jgi:hypothetical protein
VNTEPGRATRWDQVYAAGDATRSWFQQRPTMSLRMLDAAGVTERDSVIDVGGGASRLVDALLQGGFADVSVLDVSAAGLRHAQQRLAGDAGRVRWLVADVLSWRPARVYQVWHDRAVFHFLTTEQDRDRYRQTMQAAAAPTAVAVFGCFALDGPRSCSGLPVARYDAAGLATQLGPQWTLIRAEREEHATPAGAVQPFTWAAFGHQV